MFVDVDSESSVFAVGPVEAQPMQLVFVVGLFVDGAVYVDLAHDTTLQASSVPHALVSSVADRPLGARGLVAGLCSGKVQVRADVLPVIFENLNAHPICGLPSLKCTFVSLVRLTDQHGVDQLLQSDVRIIRIYKRYVFIVTISAHQVHVKPLLVPEEGDDQLHYRMIGKLLC